MQTIDCQQSTISLVSWARTARPVRWPFTFAKGATPRDERFAIPVDATDDVMFGFSTAALLVTPLALLVAVLFG